MSIFDPTTGDIEEGRQSRRRSPAPESTAVRISFTVERKARTKVVLEHLVEERLLAGATLVQAESLSWVGGEMQNTEKSVATGYTTIDKLPLIQDRLHIFFGTDTPVLSQFVMNDEKKAVLGWIERNTRE